LGTFFVDPTEVPEVAVAYVACQLGIDDSGCLKGYEGVTDLLTASDGHVASRTDSDRH